ncbi:hypothetical protein C0J52_08180 [Blattella germanica]|nr:hypothetical protein C0J52_08180 [Blattella germanica]
MSREYIEDRSEGTVESRKLYWQLQWAYGTSIQWLAGGYGFWTAWAWNSTHDQGMTAYCSLRSNYHVFRNSPPVHRKLNFTDEITGGGFIYNETELGIVAGVNWMQEGSQGVITWNCFVEGNVKGQLPWGEWELSVDDGLVIGFKKQDWKWGFTKGDIKVVSKHCATGSAVVGKRYKYYKGKEIASSVDTDPFQQTVKPRHKRSPDFFEKVSQTVKEWFQKVKKFFTGGDQQDGGDAEARDGEKKCNTFVDLMVKIIDFILGRNRNNGGGRGGSGDRPNIPQPPGGVPQGPNGEIPSDGGDPPGGAVEPPADAEEIDTAQNDAIRDWE